MIITESLAERLGSYKMAKKNFKLITTTIAVAIIVFIIFLVITITRYGWNVAIDEIIKYVLGASFTIIILGVLSFIFRHRIKSLFGR